jgi:XTP/dITP diphosphohydrolase
MQLLIATTNPGKKREMAAAFKDHYEVVALADMPNIVIVPETGETFEENAVLKAKGYFEQTGIPCVADDGGLMVDLLKGGPGVHSNRWLGEGATDTELAAAIVKALDGVPYERRTARLGGVLVYWDGERLLKYENQIYGHITLELTEPIEDGFPYRSILEIPQYDKLYSQLTEEEHDEVNFRRKSLAALKRDIRSS